MGRMGLEWKRVGPSQRQPGGEKDPALREGHSQSRKGLAGGGEDGGVGSPLDAAPRIPGPSFLSLADVLWRLYSPHLPHTALCLRSDGDGRGLPVIDLLAGRLVGCTRLSRPACASSSSSFFCLDPRRLQVSAVLIYTIILPTGLVATGVGARPVVSKREGGGSSSAGRAGRRQGPGWALFSGPWSGWAGSTTGS